MTLKTMAEQILLRKYGARYTDDADIDPREIYDLIIKEINALIKLEYTNVHLPLVERFVNGSAIATYTVSVVSDVGAKTVDKKVYDFGQFGFSPIGWATENNEYWATEDDKYWAVSGQDAIVITTELNQSKFRVTLSGYRLPARKTAQDLEAFLKAGKSDSYFELKNAQTGTPARFALAAVSNLVVSDTFLRFDYEWTQTLVLPQEVIDEIGITNDLLNGNQTYLETIVSLSRVDFHIADTRGRAKISLPAQPITLPHGMGIWSIGAKDDMFSSYVPVQPGESAIMGSVSHTGLSQIIGNQIAYEWYGHNTVYFNKNASQMPDAVTVRLVVVDPAQISENDLLPIPADYEEGVIKKVIDVISADGPADLKTDKMPVQQ